MGQVNLAPRRSLVSQAVHQSVSQHARTQRYETSSFAFNNKGQSRRGKFFSIVL